MATTHKVEVAFATQPYDPSPTWTDITAFVAAVGSYVQINRGRDDQISTITPSQISMTLVNKDGRFTPGYTSGAYYPNVVLGKRIRISTSTGAGFTERFDGFVDSWPMQWAPIGKYAEAQITASDRLKKMGRQLAADNLISTYYLASSPTDYWMFADDVGTITPYNRSGTTQLGIGFFTVVDGPAPSIDYGQGTGPGYDGLTAMEIRDTELGAKTVTNFTFSETNGVTFSGYLRYDMTAGNPAFSPVTIWDGISPAQMYIAHATNFNEIGVINSSGTAVVADGTTNVMDGATHHIGGVWQGLGVGLGGRITIYIDGVADATATVSTAIMSGGITAPLGFVAEDYGLAGTFTCAHYALFPTALTAQNMADFSSAGLNAFTGDTTLARTTRIAGLAGVTPVVTGTPGTISMAPLIDVNGADYFSLLQTVAQTEGGLLFTQCDGQVRLRPRRDMQNQATKWTLTNGQYDSDLTFVLDDFGVINDAIADRPGGNQQHLTNATSVAANGTYSISTTLQTTDDNEVLSYAQWEIATSIASTRCSQVTVNLLTQPSLVATFLTIELGDRITLTGLPPTAPASSVDLIVQGWTETIGLDQYSVTMNTSPLPITVWALNDATYSVLGSTTVLAY